MAVLACPNAHANRCLHYGVAIAKILNWYAHCSVVIAQEPATYSSSVVPRTDQVMFVLALKTATDLDPLEVHCVNSNL